LAASPALTTGSSKTSAGSPGATDKGCGAANALTSMNIMNII
jgi:hypothetical protein